MKCDVLCPLFYLTITMTSQNPTKLQHGNMWHTFVSACSQYLILHNETHYSPQYMYKLKSSKKEVFNFRLQHENMQQLFSFTINQGLEENTFPPQPVSINLIKT